jgi:hypothetical protein
VIQRPQMTLTATVLDAPDPRRLAAFYQRLLGWAIGQDEPDWVTLRPPMVDQGCRFRPRRPTSDRPGPLAPAISR